MRINRLSVRNFRLLSAVDIQPGGDLNVLVGDNAAGKTSLLESIIGLSRGRVPGSNPRSCSGPEGNWWRVEAWRTEDEATAGDLSDRLRMQWDKGLTLATNELPATARSLSRHMIVAALDPRSHELIDFGPAQRRRFLDWALFHVEPGYADTWSRWRRILEQRNKALAGQGSPAAIDAWDQGLAEAALAIHRSRDAVVQALTQDLGQAMSELFGPNEVEVTYEAGWNEQEEYAAALQRQREGDQQAGRTRAGPQRADLKIRLGGMEAEKLSRGQQKLLLSGLMISACRHVARQRETWPVLLLDDYESELGRTAQDRLAATLISYPGQAFVTQHRQESALTRMASATLFHVEHGKVTLTIQ